MITKDLAARSLPRRGTAAKLLPMDPDEYSDVTRRTPSTPMASWAIENPAPLIDVGSHVRRLLSELLA
jgi:hypothetical protein